MEEKQGSSFHEDIIVFFERIRALLNSSDTAHQKINEGLNHVVSFMENSENEPRIVEAWYDFFLKNETPITRQRVEDMGSLYLPCVSGKIEIPLRSLLLPHQHTETMASFWNELSHLSLADPMELPPSFYAKQIVFGKNDYHQNHENSREEENVLESMIDCVSTNLELFQQANSFVDVPIFQQMIQDTLTHVQEKKLDFHAILQRFQNAVRYFEEACTEPEEEEETQ